MADKDTSTEDEVLDNQEDEVETDTDVTEDETSTEDQDDSEEDTESEDSEDDSDDDSDEEEDDDEEEESEFSKSFKNIKGETPEEYIPNLEEAYRKSSREGKRLSTEKDDLQKRLDQISAVVAQNPDLKKAIEDATGEGAQNPTVDPALQQVRAEMEQRYAQEYDAFVDEHPELEEDEELQTEFLENIAIVGEAARKKGKPTPPMAEATKKAWAMMGREDDKNEKIANAAKTTASKPKSTTSKKAKPKNESKLSPEQIAEGKKMGLTEKQMLESLSK